MIAKAQNTPLERVRVLQRTLYRAAKANPTRKFGVLYDKVCRDDVLRIAYARVKANAGAPGIDGQTFEVIEKEVGVDTFLRSIKERLLRRRYRPLPVRRVYIPKADGTQRPLGIPVITDRVVQAAVKLVIEPLFEADFKDFSYGFRPGRMLTKRYGKSTSSSTSAADGWSMRTSSRISTGYRMTACCCLCGPESSTGQWSS